MEKTENTIGKEFTMKELIKFVSAPVISKLFISLLSTLDDSLFISRYCGENALAAFTLALPWFMIVDVFVMIIGAISTKCSILMGEKKNDEANSSFTTMIIVSGCLGLVFTLVLSLFMKPIFTFLGVTELTYPYIEQYVNISRFYMPLFIMGNTFARFYVVAGKPKVAVASTLVHTFCNLFFDWLLIAKLNIGIAGAAYGNLAGNLLINIIAFIFFSNKKNEIHFAKPVKDPFRLIKDVFILGKSQGLTSLAISVNSLIVNYVLLKNGGEPLVAAYSVVNNVQFMFMNAFFGFVGSTSPIVSYAYGERNAKKLSRIIKQSVILIECLALIVALLIIMSKPGVLFLYFSEDASETIRATSSFGLSVVPFCFPIFSFNVLTQEFLVAVGNHKVATFLSILENVILSNAAILVLPALFGKDIIWFVFLIYESITLLASLYVAYSHRNVYGYGKDGIATFEKA